MYNFEESKTLLYSDTLLPDIFISEYLPSLTGEQVKVYIYCVFLCKNNKKISNGQLSKSLGLKEDEIKDIFKSLIDLGLISRKNRSYVVEDLKSKEINKIYKPRTALKSEDLHNKKNIITAINKQFFQGVMPLSWYTDIEMWFNLYKFDDDVMFQMFNHCYEVGTLKRAYVGAVAKNWHNQGIKNSFDLDNYFEEYKKLKNLSTKVAKKLNRMTPFTQYEEKYIERWIKEYNYDFDIIELALKKTTGISNPNLKYVNSIISSWHKKNYKTKEDILNGETIHKNARSNNRNPEKDELTNYIKNYYMKLKEKNQQIHERRVKEIFSTIPKVKELDAEIRDLSIKSLSLDKKKKQELFSIIEKMKSMLCATLKENNYPENYLERIYSCNKCEDTGILSNGKNCSCKTKIIEEYQKKL